MRLILALLFSLSGWAQDLAFAKVGKGPGLVLIHGFGGNRGVWGDWPKAFGDRRTVLAVDLPGCGASPEPSEVDFEHQADQIAALMQAQGLGPSVIVAHSMGGLIALRLAARHAGSVSGLVLIDTPLLPLATDHAEALAQALEANPAGAFRARYGLFAKDEAQLDRVVNEAARIPGKILGAYTRARTAPNEGYVAKVACPVLLLASPILIPDAHKQSERLKEAGYAGFHLLQVVRFAESRHWIMWDEPKLAKQALQEFLANVEKR